MPLRRPFDHLTNITSFHVILDIYAWVTINLSIKLSNRWPSLHVDLLHMVTSMSQPLMMPSKPNLYNCITISAHQLLLLLGVSFGLLITFEATLIIKNMETSWGDLEVLQRWTYLHNIIDHLRYSNSLYYIWKNNCFPH